MIWLLDNGHGGIIGDRYTTAPDKMFRFPDGLTIYEGDFNRRVANILSYMLWRDSIQHFFVAPELEDISLDTRVKRANDFHRKYGNTVYLSIHGNAARGTGYEVYTSPGQTKSDRIATVFYNKWGEEIPEFVRRPGLGDGDPDKEAKFKVLVKTVMPAILTENLFMDTRRDCEFMLSRTGQERIARAHYKAIKHIEDHGL
jgi:N-acetylmuramoyl-L-alanine amidase